MIDRIALHRLTTPGLLRLVLPDGHATESYRIRDGASTTEAVYSPSTQNLLVHFGYDAEGNPITRWASGADAQTALETVFPAAVLAPGHMTLP